MKLTFDNNFWNKSLNVHTVKLLSNFFYQRFFDFFTISGHAKGVGQRCWPKESTKVVGERSLPKVWPKMSTEGSDQRWRSKEATEGGTEGGNRRRQPKEATEGGNRRS